MAIITHCDRNFNAHEVCALHVWLTLWLSRAHQGIISRSQTHDCKVRRLDELLWIITGDVLEEKVYPVWFSLHVQSWLPRRVKQNSRTLPWPASLHEYICMCQMYKLEEILGLLYLTGSSTLCTKNAVLVRWSVGKKDCTATKYRADVKDI